jgi:uncharacterized protein YtpQ (UPF0354 family)
MGDKFSLNPTDQFPPYLSYLHPENLFEIDYPANWEFTTDKDGAVEFFDPGFAKSAGILLFKTPLQPDATWFEQAGKWQEIVTALFARIESTNVRYDPAIIYRNFKADRPEADQAGQRWFVLSADLVLGISSSCTVEEKETYYPIFERMLSTLRILRDEELLASRILSRAFQVLSAQLPQSKIEIEGLKIFTDKFEVSIDNLLSQVKQNPIKTDALVDHFIQGMVGLSTANEALGQESWEAVHDRIQPLIKPEKYIREVNHKTNRNPNSMQGESAFLISAPWLADLRICFALDNQDTFRFINSADMQRWRVSLELLLQVSIENLTQFPEPELYVVKPAPEMPGIGALQPRGGASSSYLLHPKLFYIAARQLGNELVAAVPSRDALMLFEYRNEKESLQQAVGRDFASTNHPISDRLFRVTPDGIALL